MHKHLPCTLSRPSSPKTVTIVRVSGCLPGLHTHAIRRLTRREPTAELIGVEQNTIGAAVRYLAFDELQQTARSVTQRASLAGHCTAMRSRHRSPNPGDGFLPFRHEMERWRSLKAVAHGRQTAIFPLKVLGQPAATDVSGSAPKSTRSFPGSPQWIRSRKTICVRSEEERSTR